MHLFPSSPAGPLRIATFAAVLTALLWSCPAVSRSAEKPGYTITTEQARKWHGGKGGERPPMVTGDEEGPFRHVGGVVMQAIALKDLSVNAGMKSSSTSTGIQDPKVLLQVDYFINEKGNGLMVAQEKPAEDPVPAAPLDDEEEEEDDERPGEHIELCKAAESAIYRGNTRVMALLLQAGFSVNEPLNWDNRWTALHYAAIHNQPRVAALLLEHGAALEQRCKHGERAIDYAFEDEATQMCEVLRKPDEKGRSTGGYPDGLLEELFPYQKPSKYREEVRFLSLNGADPSDEMLDYFRDKWPNVRRRSMAEEISGEERDKLKAPTFYRDKKTKDYGMIVEVILKKDTPESYDWSNRQAVDPFLAGGGARGKISKKYGYWIKHGTKGWDE